MDPSSYPHSLQPHQPVEAASSNTPARGHRALARAGPFGGGGETLHGLCEDSGDLPGQKHQARPSSEIRDACEAAWRPKQQEEVGRSGGLCRS